MPPGLLLLLCASTALAQFSRIPGEITDPIAAKIEARRKASEEGRFADAAALREGARTILSKLPAESPQFTGWVQSVVSEYEGSGRMAQARAIIEDALARVNAKSADHTVLLQWLARLWQNDGNLLKAVATLEQVAAGPPSVAPKADPQPAYVMVTGTRWFAPSVNGADFGAVYAQLARIYRELGRPEAVQANVKKLRALSAKSNDARYAWFFVERGDVDEAASILRQEIDCAKDPAQASYAWQQLVNAYAHNGRNDDAISAARKALSVLPPENQIGIRNAMIQALMGAGRKGEAEDAYRDLLAGSRPTESNYLYTLTQFARTLTENGKGSEAEALLQRYRAGDYQRQPHDETEWLQAMFTVAQSAHDKTRAEEFLAQIRDRQTKQAAANRANLQGKSIAESLQKAQIAANEGKPEEALRLTLEAIDQSSRALDREQIAWQAPQVASTLWYRNGRGEAEQIYARLFSVVEGWVVDTNQPLLVALRQRIQFLQSKPERVAEAPTLLDRFRNLLVALHGTDSSAAGEALSMAVMVAAASNRRADGVRAASDFVEHESRLTGTTSERYLRALQTLAEAHERATDLDSALRLYGQRIEIADAAFAPRDEIRTYVRTDLAQYLARRGKFEQVDQLLDEAGELSKKWVRPNPTFIDTLRKNLGEMRTVHNRRAVR